MKEYFIVLFRVSLLLLLSNNGSNSKALLTLLELTIKMDSKHHFSYFDDNASLIDILDQTYHEFKIL